MKKKNLKSVRKSISRSLSVSKSPWLAVMMLRSHVIKPSPRPGGRLHTACVWQASEMETFKSCERIYFLSYYFLRSIERPYLPVPASGKIFNKCIVSIFCHTFVSGGKKKNCLFLFTRVMWAYVSATEVQLVCKCWQGTNKLSCAIIYYSVALFLTNFMVHNQFSFMFLHFSWKPS